MKRIGFSLTFLSCLLASGLAFGAVTSLDNTFVPNDVYASDFTAKLNRNFNQVLTGGVNNIQSANIADATITVADMADEASPVIRTKESASCPDYVFTGLLPQTSASLAANTTAGTGYPDGVRVVKNAATLHSYTASKWTWVDLDTNGDFHYSETSFGASAPSVFANSMRLALVSSDGTTVNTVTDLRTTSCTTGNLSNFTNATGEASINDILKNGAPFRQTNAGTAVPSGFAQGSYISYFTGQSFKVDAGSLYINGSYRSNPSQLTIPSSEDNPGVGISGITSGSLAASQTYKIYAVADVPGVKTYSVSFGTTPAGLTNYRQIGTIVTSSDTAFVSSDVVTLHTLSKKEIVSSWVIFNAVGTVTIKKSYNVSGITDEALGVYTIAWDNDYVDSNYVLSGMASYTDDRDVAIGFCIINPGVYKLKGSVRIGTHQVDNSTAVDPLDTTIMAIGDLQ